MFKNHIDALWAGTETSLHTMIEAQNQMKLKIASGWEDPEEEEAGPRLLDVQGRIGVISIKGPLVSGEDSWIHEMFGVTSYGAIRDALISAASDPEVDHILLDIDSGGGAVSGVMDASKAISMVNEKVKPVTAYAENAASAAYWLGSSAGKVYAGETSIVGSIGVIATHKEYSKALADAGVGVTVIRAGKYKALANGVEPLTEEAKAQIQTQLDDAYKIFVSHVAEQRGVPYEYADTHMAQGKEFFGARAEEAGLVDGIMSFDTLFAKIQQDIIDYENHSHHNAGKINHMGNGTMTKKALTALQMAALAEGVAVTAGAPDVAPESVADAVEPAAEAVVESVAAEAAEPVAAEAATDTSTELVAYLNAQLQEKDKAVLEAAVKLSKAEEKLAEMSAAHEALVAIAAKSINNMQIALGGSASDFVGAKAEAVVAEHARLTEQFMSKFKAGGVSALSTPASEEKSEPVVDAITKARFDALRFPK